MKRRLLAALAISALMLSACGGGNDSSSSDSSGSSSSSQSTSATTSGHTHSFVFESFEWTTTTGNYTAKAVYKCAADGEIEKHDANMSKTTDAPTHVAGGANYWKASHDGHEEIKVEELPATGHVYNAVGYCVTDGAYLGVEATVGYNTSPAKYSAGQKYYFRAYVNAGHTYSLQNLGVTPSETKSYYMDEEGVAHEYDKSAVEFPTAVLNSYIYFVFEPQADTDDNAMFRVNLKSHGSALNDYGYCLVHDEYVGNDFDTNDPIDLDDIAVGQKVYRRFEASIGHQYQVENISGSVDLDHLMFGICVDGNWSSITITNEYAQLSGVSDDGYVYVTAFADTATIVDATLRISETHLYNAVGLCLHDNVYLPDGEELELGVACSDIAFAAGDTLYYRVGAYANHTYMVSPHNWQMANTYAYYLDADCIPHELEIHTSTSPYVTDPFPENTYNGDTGSETYDGYLYFVYTPQGSGSGYFTVYEIHPEGADGEHGACPRGYLGDTLTFDVPSDSYNIAVGEYLYFRILINTIVLDSYNDFFVNYGGNWYQRISAWYKAGGVWTQLDPEDDGGGPGGEYYDGNNLSSDDGYLYFEFYNSGAVSMNVNGFEVVTTE